MVRVRRAVVEEKDRYGGYIRRDDVQRKPVEVDLNVDPDLDLSFSRRSTPVEPMTERQYQSPYSTVPSDSRFVQKVEAPTRRKRTVRRESEDIMPSIKTRAYMNQTPDTDEHVEDVEQPKQKAMLSAKSKVMLIVYIAAVVILAAVVLATGISLSSASARVTALEGQIAERNAVIAGQVTELAALENDATLTGMATELGMHKVNTATEIELLPEVAPISYEARTNWFDKLCDWLSNLV